MVSLILYAREKSIACFLWNISKRGLQGKSTNFRCPFESSVNYELFGEDRPFISMTNLGHAKRKSRKVRAKSKSRSNHPRWSFCNQPLMSLKSYGF